MKPNDVRVNFLLEYNPRFADARQAAQRALREAVGMGCEEPHARRLLHQLVDDLENPYDPST